MGFFIQIQNFRENSILPMMCPRFDLRKAANTVFWDYLPLEILEQGRLQKIRRSEESQRLTIPLLGFYSLYMGNFAQLLQETDGIYKGTSEEKEF